MARRILHGWHLVRTALGFALFGAGGAVLGVVVVPLLRLFDRAPERFDLRAQRWVQRSYALFVAYMEGARLIEVERIGTAALLGPGPRLIVPNHPSLIDTPLVGAMLPQADCIAKPAWANLPLLGRAIAAADYIRAERGGAVVDEAAARLAAGRSVLIFPEGTRTAPDRRLGRLHRGAAHIALRSGVDLLPVLITCVPRALTRGEKWYQVPEERLRYTVRVLEPLRPKDVLEGGETTSLAARRVTAALERRFQNALDAAERAGEA